MLCKEQILPRDLGNSINMEKEQRPALGREGIAVSGAGAAESWGEGKAEMGRMMGGDVKVEGWVQGAASAALQPWSRPITSCCTCTPLRAPCLHGKSLSIV